MPYYLTKVLPLLFMPVAVGLVLLLSALLLLLKNRRQPAIFFLIATILVIWVSSLPVVANRLLWSLERQYQPVAMADIPLGDCIVVLGGAVGNPGNPLVELEMTGSTDRVYQTARLYRNGKAARVIVAAGNQPWNRDKLPEAELIAKLLMEWGVPRQSILLDRTSRNTRENAINAALLLDRNDCQRNLLVTSARHMLRAVAAFEQAGVDVFPVSADIRSFNGDIDSIAALIPRAGALEKTSQALNEWMGVWVYRLRGWN